MTLMIGRISKVRHAVVGVAIGGSSLLGLTGLIGAGNHPERFDAKLIVVSPAGGDGLRITEYVDQDFGHHRRHGYERVIPNDFGAPIDVRAASPDAPDAVSVTNLGDRTQIRIGDPDITKRGQHRYELSYTLPDAELSQFGLALDIVAAFGDGWPGDNETGRMEVIVTGFELGNVRCDLGPVDAVGGCDLVQTSNGTGTYRVVVEPLQANDGLSIYADVIALAEPVDVGAPELPGRRSDYRWLLAAALIPAGLAGAYPIYRWARRKGSNEVFAGGAADAAYGTLPAPRADGTFEPSPPVLLVPDDKLAELATIEFVPPKGIQPWQAQVLMTERITDDTVTAWFSGLAGREAIVLDGADSKLSIASGPRRNELNPHDTQLLATVLSQRDPYVTGTYDPQFAAAWSSVRAMQTESIASSGWWKRLSPGSGFGPQSGGSPFAFLAIIVFALVWAGSAVTAAVGLIRSWPLAVAFGLLLPAIIAFFMYRTLLPARTAQGSALALRTESFRRFLDASEGKHVEWAWSQGLLREYSAWAVALGEADAWNRALGQANIPAPARLMAGPILIHSMGSSMHSSRTAPSSSGSSGGGGGGGGGGSGGGGGGGSSGSW